MDPLEIIFSSLSDLTGGLISDVTSVIVAMVALSIILMGLELIKDALESHMETKGYRESLSELEYLDRKQRNGRMSNAERDVLTTRYRNKVREVAKYDR